MVDSVEETPAPGQRARAAERNPGPTEMGVPRERRTRTRRDRSRSRSTTPRRRIEVVTTDNPQPDQPQGAQAAHGEAPDQPKEQGGQVEGEEEVMETVRTDVRVELLGYVPVNTSPRLP